MRHFKHLSLALVSMFTLAAVMVASASAAHMTLPSWTVATPSTGTSGEGKLVSKAGTFTCKSDTSATSAGTNLGTYTIDLKECEETKNKVTCNTKGDAAKTILTEGTWHLVLKTSGSADVRMLWFLLKTSTLECTALATIILRGNLLGGIEPAGKSTTHYSIKVALNGAGGQEYTSFENENGTIVDANLESNLNGGAFSAATEASAGNNITTEKLTEIIN
jgi:hypothetical protein